MPDEKPLALLLYSGQHPEAFEEALADVGIASRVIPVLSFEVVNQEALRQALEHPYRYDGLIFSSPRAVDAIAEVMPWLPTENVHWHAKPVFAVGPRTADELRSIGFDPEGAESGSAELLAEYVVERRYEKPLLFLCGDRRREELPDTLHRSRVDLEEIVVYRSEARSHIELAGNRRPTWVVLFSPSGIEAMETIPHVGAGGIRIAAIGPTTAEVAEERGFRVDAVADEPSPKGIASAVSAAMQR